MAEQVEKARDYVLFDPLDAMPADAAEPVQEPELVQPEPVQPTDEYSALEVSFNPLTHITVPKEVPTARLDRLVSHRMSNYEAPAVSPPAPARKRPHSHAKSVRFDETSMQTHRHRQRAPPPGAKPHQDVPERYKEWANKDKIRYPSNPFVKEMKAGEESDGERPRTKSRHAQRHPSERVLQNPTKKRQIQEFAQGMPSAGHMEEEAQYQQWADQQFRPTPPPEPEPQNRMPPSQRPRFLRRAPLPSSPPRSAGMMMDSEDEGSASPPPQKRQRSNRSSPPRKRQRSNRSNHSHRRPPSDSESGGSDSDSGSDAEENGYRFDTFGDLRGLSENDQRKELLKRKQQLKNDGLNVEDIFDMMPITDMMAKIEAAENQQKEDFYLEMGEMALIGIFLTIEKTNLQTGEFLKIHGVSKHVFENRLIFRQPIRKIIRLYVTGGGGSQHPVIELMFLIAGTLFLKHMSGFFDNMFQNMSTSSPIFNMLYQYMMGGGMQTSDFANMLGPMLSTVMATSAGQAPAPGGPMPAPPTQPGAAPSPAQQQPQQQGAPDQMNDMLQSLMQGLAGGTSGGKANVAMNNTRDRTPLVEPQGGYKYDANDLNIHLRGNVQPVPQSA